MAIIRSDIQLKRILKRLRIKKKKLVVTNGCFDILHSGHIKLIRQSKEFGDILILLINTDKSVKKNKGNSRPILKENIRLKILSSIKYIDYIIPFDDKTPVKLYKIIRPDILVKGRQYKKDKIAGSKIILKYGGKIKLVKMVNKISTSIIIDKIKNLWLL